MKLKLMAVCCLLALMASGMQLQANFIQCVLAFCGGSLFSDVINGREFVDDIWSYNGNDVVFANDGTDRVLAGRGNDFLFGGNGSDLLAAGQDNDTLLAGPDDGVYRQVSFGGPENDSYYTFASETSTCLFFEEESGFDVANLIGFGPYSAAHPFGQADGFMGYILEIDPIAGGNVLIHIDADDDSGTEIIHGLTTPTPTVIAIDDPIVLNCPELDPQTPQGI